MRRSAMGSSPHQKTHKVDQIHVAGLDLLSVRCGTPDKVCRETGHLPRISGCSCRPRLIWVKDRQRLAMVHPYMLWTSHQDHREHGHCGSGDSMRIFSVGYDHMVLLQCLSFRRGIAVAMFASRARSRNAIVSLLGPQRLVCRQSLPVSLRT